MAISMRTGNSTKTRSINAIIRPNFQRCPRRGHTCNSFLEDNADGMTLQDRRLEAQGLRRCSKRATPELLCKLWKSHGRVDESRSTKPWRILCAVDAKLLAMLVQHGVFLVSCWAYL